jgi:hypothetical protein
LIRKSPSSINSLIVHLPTHAPAQLSVVRPRFSRRSARRILYLLP